MSSSLIAVPLHTVDDETLRWVAGKVPGGVGPERRPEVNDLPMAREVLTALAGAGCHGDPWFTVAPGDEQGLLPRCPDRLRCSEQGGLDLGEVMLRTPKSDPTVDSTLDSSSRIASLSFRRPSGVAVAEAVSALARAFGSWLVFDDQGNCAVVHPEASAPDLAEKWPWE